MGGYKGGRHPGVVKDVLGMLEHGVSVMATHADEMLVGIRISFVIDRHVLKRA